jgi:hypothetical protein
MISAYVEPAERRVPVKVSVIGVLLRMSVGRAGT